MTVPDQVANSKIQFYYRRREHMYDVSLCPRNPGVTPQVSVVPTTETTVAQLCSDGTEFAWRLKGCLN